MKTKHKLLSASLILLLFFGIYGYSRTAKQEYADILVWNPELVASDDVEKSLDDPQQIPESKPEEEDKFNPSSEEWANPPQAPNVDQSELDKVDEILKNFEDDTSDVAQDDPKEKDQENKEENPEMPKDDPNLAKPEETPKSDPKKEEENTKQEDKVEKEQKEPKKPEVVPNWTGPLPPPPKKPVLKKPKNKKPNSLPTWIAPVERIPLNKNPKNEDRYPRHTFGHNWSSQMLDTSRVSWWRPNLERLLKITERELDKHVKTEPFKNLYHKYKGKDHIRPKELLEICRENYFLKDTSANNPRRDDTWHYCHV